MQVTKETTLGFQPPLASTVLIIKDLFTSSENHQLRPEYSYLEPFSIIVGPVSRIMIYFEFLIVEITLRFTQFRCTNAVFLVKWIHR